MRSSVNLLETLHHLDWFDFDLEQAILVLALLQLRLERWKMAKQVVKLEVRWPMVEDLSGLVILVQHSLQASLEQQIKVKGPVLLDWLKVLSFFVVPKVLP